jgi:hypothetical protein
MTIVRPRLPTARVQIIAIGKFETAETGQPAARPASSKRRRGEEERKRLTASPWPRPNVGREERQCSVSFRPDSGLLFGISCHDDHACRRRCLERTRSRRPAKLRVAIAISPAGGAFWSTRD